MIVGVAMVRDEADIIEATLRHHAAQGIERFVVADNGSADGTRDVIDGLGLPLTVVDDHDPAHYQGAKMTALVRRHCEPGDWIVPFDADELWSGESGTLARAFASTAADVLLATVFDYLPQPDDGDDPDPVRRIRWREATPEPLPVVAFRHHPGAVLHDGNHGVDRPGPRASGLVVRHYQYRTWEQFRRKVRQGRAALAATDLPESTGAHWRTLGALGDEALHREWLTLLGAEGLVYDPCPSPSA
jgi:hypothetical protein